MSQVYTCNDFKKIVVSQKYLHKTTYNKSKKYIFNFFKFSNK